MSTFIITTSGEQEKLMTDFLKEQHIPFLKDDEPELPQFVLDGIKRGQEDIKAGRFITYEEFKKKYPVE